jgi:hypothetical protein
MKPAEYSLSQLRSHVISLTVLCPFDLSNPCHCPLHEIRRKSPIERLDWVDSLTADEVESLLLNHQKCLSAKLAGQ